MEEEPLSIACCIGLFPWCPAGALLTDGPKPKKKESKNPRTSRCVMTFMGMGTPSPRPSAALEPHQSIHSPIHMLRSTH